jgi:hypothetical protein
MELTEEKLKVLLERAEVNPKPEDFAVVLRMMGPYLERLSKFREVDLSGEEVAGTYTPPVSRG